MQIQINTSTNIKTSGGKFSSSCLYLWKTCRARWLCLQQYLHMKGKLLDIDPKMEMFGVKSAFLSCQRHVNLEHISCKSFRNVKLIERSLRSSLFQKYFEPPPDFRSSLTRQIPIHFIHSLPNND